MPESAGPENPKGKLGRLIFFGPKKTIRKLKTNPRGAPLGAPNRQGNKGIDDRVRATRDKPGSDARHVQRTDDIINRKKRH